MLYIISPIYWRIVLYEYPNTRRKTNQPLRFVFLLGCKNLLFFYAGYSTTSLSTNDNPNPRQYIGASFYTNIPR